MRPALHHLAQVNIARMIAPLDSPLMADFVSQLAGVNAIAESSPGFVWRLATPQGDATAVRVYDDPFILLNMSVWESIEALKSFTYRAEHLAVFRDRARWFERPTSAHMAMWWIPAGHRPGVDEAVARLDHRRQHGDTPAAFSFASPYPSPQAADAATAP